MSRFTYMIETVLILGALAVTVEACSPAYEWKSWSMERLLYLADIVVHCKVLDQKEVNASESTDGIPKLDVKLQVYCVYKGDYTAISENITISNADYLNSCFHSNTEVGEEYIAMLSRNAHGKYSFHEMNLQGAIFPANKDNLRTVLDVCGLQSPNEPSDRPDRPDNSDTPFCGRIALIQIYPQPTITCTNRGETVVGSLLSVLLVSLTGVLLHH